MNLGSINTRQAAGSCGRATESASHSAPAHNPSSFHFAAAGAAFM